jgi:tripartite-type tricarboxylate transporter receptor subunit TctC
MAQGTGAKPIRVVVGFAAGSGADVTARLTSQPLSEALKHPVVVDNRPGGAGAIAADIVAKAPKDGNTLLLVTASDTILPALRTDLPYDLEKDFAPISLLANGAYVLVVHPSLPVRSVKDLLDLARREPGRLTYGTSGVGSSSHLAGELLGHLAKVKFLAVAYRSATLAATATASGEIVMNFANVPGAMPLMEAGKIKALAVTGARRATALPQVPTLEESGVKGYDRTTWHGLMAPRGTPAEVIARINAAAASVVGTAEIKALFLKQGIEAQSSSPDELARHIRREIADNSSLVRLSGATAQ